MVLVVQAVWNLATGIVLAAAVVYSYRVYRTFKGGDLTKAYSYLLLALGVMLGAFFLKFVFNLFEFEPIASLDISVRDLGVLIAAFLLVLSVREVAKFWRLK